MVRLAAVHLKTDLVYDALTGKCAVAPQLHHVLLNTCPAPQVCALHRICVLSGMMMTPSTPYPAPPFMLVLHIALPGCTTV